MLTVAAVVTLSQSLHNLLPHLIQVFVLCSAALYQITCSTESVIGTAKLPLAVHVYSHSSVFELKLVYTHFRL